jgi:prepilin-type processing-associated H-X9-DG protein
VVIGVISLLLALALPAVQQARASARRTQCLNNLRQQITAIQNHAALFGQLPTGGWGYSWLGVQGRGANQRQPGGWIFNILPQIEQAAVQQLAPSSDPWPPDPLRIPEYATRSLPAFTCPERRKPQPGPASNEKRYFELIILKQCSKSDYAINGGTKFFRSISGPTSLVEGDSESFAWPDTSPLDGISFLRSTIRFSDLTDGSSQVLAIGEKWLGSTEEEFNGDDQPLYSGDCLDIRRWATVAPARDRHELGSHLAFGSAHVGGAGFAFCDGSVKTIPYYVDPRIFQRIASRNDGGVVGNEW